MVDGIYFGYSGIKLERGCEYIGTRCLCELAALYDVLWLIFASFCAHFGFSVVTSGCEVLQLDFCRFWRFLRYWTQQISGFYDNGVMVQLFKPVVDMQF